MLRKVDQPCRSCGKTNMTVFLDLGTTPLADRLLSAERLGQPEPVFPLETAFCPDCSLVQILEEVPPQQLYADEYPYYSSFSDALLAHSRENALGLIESRKLGPNSLVVELASNDGYLLKNFVEHGVPVLGIDPADGPAASAEKIGVPTLVEFWGDALAQKLRADGKRADVIIGNNVMAHIPDLNGFVEGMSILVADDGVISIENPYVRDLIDHVEFDTIYHEHHCYFSCTAVDAVMRRHGLFLNDVKYFPKLHGGTLRWICGPREQVTDTAKKYLDDEANDGLTRIEYYAAFSDRVETLRTQLRELLGNLKADGKTIAAYGAAAKGATMVNYVGLGTDLIDFVVDRNVHKHGRYMPGVRIPILPAEALVERKPDYTLMLAWNFADEIISQQQAYVAGGGKFIVPVPSPRIV
ncbi:MAG: class I SAM-dependent methyltransferase [Acidimicrobiia bacterium]